MFSLMHYQSAHHLHNLPTDEGHVLQLSLLQNGWEATGNASIAPLMWISVLINPIR